MNDASAHRFPLLEMKKAFFAGNEKREFTFVSKFPCAAAISFASENEKREAELACTGFSHPSGGEVSVLGGNPTFNRTVLRDVGVFLHFQTLLPLDARMRSIAFLWSQAYGIPRKTISEVAELLGVGDSWALKVREMNSSKLQRFMFALAICREVPYYFLDIDYIDESDLKRISPLLLEKKKRCSILLFSINEQRYDFLIDEVFSPNGLNWGNGDVQGGETVYRLIVSDPMRAATLVDVVSLQGNAIVVKELNIGKTIELLETRSILVFSVRRIFIPGRVSEDE
ncbi:MAG: hypothetical protein QXP70_05510 [Methanomassiliicoccales archaeon]